MKRPPPPGSPMEIISVLIWKMRQDIEFQKSRVMIQALLSQKGAEDKSILEAFSDLKEAFFPFDKNQKKNDLQQMRERLFREIQRGPLEVTPLVDLHHPKVASRLVQGQQELAHRQELMRQGKIRNVDAFDRVRRKPRPASS